MNLNNNVYARGHNQPTPMLVATPNRSTFTSHAAPTPVRQHIPAPVPVRQHVPVMPQPVPATSFHGRTVVHTPAPSYYHHRTPSRFFWSTPAPVVVTTPGPTRHVVHTPSYTTSSSHSSRMAAKIASIFAVVALIFLFALIIAL
jgi:hypothetical protein